MISYSSAARRWCLVALVALPSVARAQDGSDTGFDAEHFRPPGGSRDMVITSSPEVAGDLQVGGGFILNYARRPLIWAARGSDGELGRTGRAAIDDRVNGDLYASIGLLDRMEVAVALPVGLWQDGRGIAAGGDVAAAGLGDVRLGVKVLLVDQDDHGVGVAFTPRVSFPSGDPKDLRGDGFLTFSPAFVVGHTADTLRISGELGATLRSTKEVSNVEIGEQLFYRAGLGVEVDPDEVELIVELFGLTTLGTLFQDDGDDVADESPLEGLLAARFHIYRDLLLTTGLGTGIVAGYGAPQYRLFLGASWSPTDSDRDGDGILDRLDQCPDDPEDRDGWEDGDGCPDLDNDADRVPDEVDACPTPEGPEPEALKAVQEDPDGFQDEDGCPDPDNDEDGILDVVDRCPNDPEDFDSFEDKDGCPDLDNDQDKILDVDDQCPVDAEDYDGFQDEDGCPDPDNDGDGILDVDDQCPNEPEDMDGHDDEDGCPDAPTLVVIKDNRIETLEPVHFEFDSDVIKEVSHGLLDQVAGVILSNPQYKRLRIEGHTDSKGRASYNLDLSQRRSLSVLRYLAGKGVEPERLIAQGFGEDRPIATNRTKAGRAKNRRVEFHIVESE